MNTKVFNEFAEQIRLDLKHEMVTHECAVYAARTFADVAKQINVRFDRERFMRACGLFECEKALDDDTKA